MTIKKLLKNSSQQLKNISKTSILDVEILLFFVLKKSKEYLYANLDKELTKNQVEKFKKLLERRKKGEPIAYIINKKYFYGLNLFIDKRVLIPRPETEVLVETVLNNEFGIMPPRGVVTPKGEIKNHELRIADVGTGSGCIAIALAKNLAGAKIWAIDISKKALEVTRKNVEKHGVEKQVKSLHGDLLKPLGKNKVDIICANLPYLTIEQLGMTEKDVREFEPKNALVGNQTLVGGLSTLVGGLSETDSQLTGKTLVGGLSETDPQLAGKTDPQLRATETYLYEKLLDMAPKYLNENGMIFLEIDPVFKIKLIKLIKLKLPGAKFRIKKDLAGRDRVMVIRMISTQL